VYCAGGVRSAFAAKTLAELGYTDVVSMAGGFGRWKDEGRDWKHPGTLTAEQRNRYQRHLLLPEVGVEGQQKLLDAKVLMLGAGGLGSPAALYLAAAGVGTIGIVDMDEVDASRTCSARSCTTSIASATARSTRPRRRSRCSTPTSTWSPTTPASTRRTSWTSSPATT
jgi:hypothetical protein